ncbi:GntR family transcriptional regulator [Thalassobacillus sp. CUG 92003]|uniref:GntR family transcriptional regulator n=1 Tax=Thalassobacillus sp. CUG 92003 TaxID=2736641 RepID=UPI002104CAAF|nr:GntR family transcriptional regulator [Thalassobacillus sp. CUG 92003]
MKLDPNTKLLLKDFAYEKIKEGILHERYKPGSFISEKDLIEELEMSKTPIKSAIVRLESEGFVKVSSKRGIIINDLSIDRINDIYNLRIALESFNCEQIYNKITGHELESIEKNLNDMEQIVEELNVTEFARVDHEFHRMISKIAGNEEIQRILINYGDHLFRITLKHLNRDPIRMRRFYEDHILIFDKLKNHDIKSAKMMRKHLENSKLILFQ